ncbi:hypothetical protein ACFL0L_04660 [Patescibacteria group bacterium]
MEHSYKLNIRLWDKTTLPLFISSAVVFLAHLAILVIRVKPTQLPVPLHYNIFFGIDLVGDWWFLYLLPALGMVLLLMNALIASLIPSGYLLRIILYSCVLISQIILITSFLLLLQNILI